MAARAVVIGSEIEGLTGVGRDLDLVAELLSDRGFEIRRHEKGTATRDAIGLALRELAADTRPGDAVAVYYSGHGGRALDTEPPLAGGLQAAQFIAPYDYPDTTADDFRGITALELSVHMAALSERTSNVTVLLDCCYSSRMARHLDLVPKAIPHTTYVDVAAHLARVGIDELARGLGRNVEGNPDVVRLVAAGPAQQAFEYQGPDGQVGLFTEALHRLLTAAGDTPLTWAAVARELRKWVQVLAPNQRPEAEGPASRLLFTTDVRSLTGVLTVATATGPTS
jgi:Caspase domain